MKKFLVFLVCAVALNAQTQKEFRSQLFEQDKKFYVNSIDKEIAVLKTRKDCLIKSTTKKAKDSCNRDFRAKIKTLKAERKTKNKELKQKRQEFKMNKIKAHAQGKVDKPKIKANEIKAKTQNNLNKVTNQTLDKKEAVKMKTREIKTNIQDKSKI